VRAVHHHPYPVQLGDQIPAVGRQALVALVEATTPSTVGDVVGRYQGPDPQVVELLDPLEVSLQRSAVLEVECHRYLPTPSGAVHVLYRRRGQQLVFEVELRAPRRGQGTHVRRSVWGVADVHRNESAAGTGVADQLTYPCRCRQWQAAVLLPQQGRSGS